METWKGKEGKRERKEKKKFNGILKNENRRNEKWKNEK